MKVNPSKYIKTFATYDDLFGVGKYDRTKLIELISKLSLGGILDLISQITSLARDDKKVKDGFISFIRSFEDKNLNPKIFDRINDRLQKRSLYSQQGLLTTWKWLLAYGDKSLLDNEVNIDRGICQILYICLIVSDYLYEEGDSSDSLIYELFRNAAFNSTTDWASTISRACYVFIELAKDKSLFNEKEYVDFNTDFLNYYGYTLKEYLAVVFGLLAVYMNANNEIKPGWRRPLNTLFVDTTLNSKAIKIIEPLLIDYDNATEWALRSLNSSWDFSLFQEKPLFKLIDGTIFPVMPKLLYEQLFNGLYYKVRNCYSQNDTNFQRFFGRPFEIYVSLLIQEAVKTSTLPYIVIPEFNYGKGKGKKSPDVMLRLGDKLLVIEAKSRRLRMNSLIGKDSSSVDQDTKQMVLRPLQQAHDSLQDILNSNIKELEGISEIYLMVVTLGDFPSIPIFETKIREKTKVNFTLPIKYFFHLEIEEFEMLTYLISRKHGSPIFRILNNKAKNCPDMSFRNFIFASSLPRRRPEFVHKKGMEFVKEIQELLFPKTV